MTPTDEQEAQEVRTLLVHLGTAMVATGQPINEVEDELAEVALALGHPDAQIAAGPTGVTLSLASGASRSAGSRPVSAPSAGVTTTRTRSPGASS